MTQFRHPRRGILAATTAIYGFRGDIEARHDGGIHGGKVEFADLLVIADDRRKDQPALVGLEQVEGRSKRFRLLFPVGDQDAVAAGGFQLHRCDAGARRCPGHLLQS